MYGCDPAGSRWWGTSGMVSPGVSTVSSPLAETMGEMQPASMDTPATAMNHDMLAHLLGIRSAAA